MMYYQNPYAYKKPTKRTAKVTVDYDAGDVWAASWQAYVTNGRQYIKIADLTKGEKSNRAIVEELLADVSQITEESREAGNVMHRYFKGLTFKVIEGKALSSFMQSAYDTACKERVSAGFELAVVISLPATYEKNTKRDDIDRRINFARGGYLGTIGDKVTAEIEVVKQVWSQKWNTYYITGITDTDQVLFFAYRNNIEIGDRVKITGTVKGTRDKSTQLNRVKVI